MKKLLLSSALLCMLVSCIDERSELRETGIAEERILFSGTYIILNDSIAQHKSEKWLFKKGKTNKGDYRYYYIR